MCRKTMDMKRAHMKPDCLSRIVSPRCGLGLIRDSIHQNEALRLGPWRSDVVNATIGKYTHRDKKKRARFLKLTREAKEMKRMEENNHAARGETRLCQPPAGAMAPANTTQYLMSRFYDDFQQRVRVMSLSTVLQQQQQRGEPGSPQQDTDRTLLDREEACLSFQQRDFEEQFGALW